MSDTASKAKDKAREGGVRVLRGVRGLSPNPEDELLVRTDEPVYQLTDGTVRTGVGDQDDAFQVLPAGSTVTVGQAREYGLSADVDPAKLEERREQFPDYVGGSAAVDEGAVSRVSVAGSTRGPLDDDMTVQTAEEVEQRVQDAIEAHRTGEKTAEQREAERESAESEQAERAEADKAPARAAAVRQRPAAQSE